MPTYIDGIMEPPMLYYSDGDGNYVPFMCIQEAKIKLEIQNGPNIVVPSFTQTEELCFSMTMTPASSKRCQKILHAFSNRIKRKARTMKRQKEKQRRDRLKGKI